MFELSAKELNNFLDKVDRRGEDECWPWKGSARGGYGRVRLRSNNYNATEIVLSLEGFHRKGCELAIHSCDNRGCCNPKHLRYGSASENAYDRSERNVEWYLNRFKSVSPGHEKYIRDLYHRRSLFAAV